MNEVSKENIQCQGKCLSIEEVVLIRDLIKSVTALARKMVEIVAAYVAPPESNDQEHDIRKTITQIIAARHLRDKYFDSNLLADPAWDILLDLFLAELSGRRLSVSSVCVGARVPPSTGLRWISLMVRKGMLVRHPDPRDSRRSFVVLHKDTSTALHSYFADLRERGAIGLAVMGA